MAAPPQGSNFGNTHALKMPQKKAARPAKSRGGGLCIFPAGIPRAGAGAALRPEIPAGEAAVFRRWRNKKVAVIKTTTLFGGDDQI